MIGTDQARSTSLTTNIRIHAGELAVEPHLQILRRNRRSLLLRLEYAHRSTLENHVHRSPRLGSRRSLIVRVGITWLSPRHKRSMSKKRNSTWLMTMPLPPLISPLRLIQAGKLERPCFSRISRHRPAGAAVENLFLRNQLFRSDSGLRRWFIRGTLVNLATGIDRRTRLQHRQSRTLRASCSGVPRGFERP